MREMSHRLVIFLQISHFFGENGRENAVSTYAARLSVTKKVAEGRPRARLDELSQITEKSRSYCTFLREVSHRFVIFLQISHFLVKMGRQTPFRRTQRVYP
jgi:hypothetical protein